YVSRTDNDWVPLLLLILPVGVLLFSLLLRPLTTGFVGLFVWGFAGVLLIAGCYVVRHMVMSVLARSIGIAVIAGLAFVGLIVLMIVDLSMWPRFTSWSEFSPRGSGCRVTMPGSPRLLSG